MKVIYTKIKNMNDFIDAIRLRTDVFLIEQKCPPGWEPDELDKVATHLVATIDNKIIATIRLREEPKNIAKLERLVVNKNYRKRGIGSSLVNYAVKQAKRKGFKRIWLQGQKRVYRTFEKVGFKIISQEYDLFNLGIPHIDMELLLK